MPPRLPLLLLLLLFTLPACSLPRGIGMHCLGIANSPLPPNAQRTEFHNHPFYTMGDPGISTTIHTHDPAQPAPKDAKNMQNSDVFGFSLGHF